AGNHAGYRHQSVGILMMLVAAYAVKAELIGVDQLVHIAIVELGTFAGIVISVRQRDPGGVVGLVVVEIEVGKRHQVDHVELHGLTSAMNLAMLAATSPVFSTCGR